MATWIWGGVGGVGGPFYVAVWEVRGIIDCYNWCPLISWQHCRIPRGLHVSKLVYMCVCVCVCVQADTWMAVEQGCDKHTGQGGSPFRSGLHALVVKSLGKSPVELEEEQTHTRRQTHTLTHTHTHTDITLQHLHVSPIFPYTLLIA